MWRFYCLCSSFIINMTFLHCNMLEISKNLHKKCRWTWHKMNITTPYNKKKAEMKRQIKDIMFYTFKLLPKIKYTYYTKQYLAMSSRFIFKMRPFMLRNNIYFLSQQSGEQWIDEGGIANSINFYPILHPLAIYIHTL